MPRYGLILRHLILTGMVKAFNYCQSIPCCVSAQAPIYIGFIGALLSTPPFPAEKICGFHMLLRLTPMQMCTNFRRHVMFFANSNFVGVDGLIT